MSFNPLVPVTCWIYLRKHYIRLHFLWFPNTEITQGIAIQAPGWHPTPPPPSLPPTTLPPLCRSTSVSYGCWRCHGCWWPGDTSAHRIFWPHTVCNQWDGSSEDASPFGSKNSRQPRLRKFPDWRITVGLFNIKMLSYQYRESHYKDKTVVRPSYLYQGNLHTGKMASLYWISPLIVAVFFAYISTQIGDHYYAGLILGLCPAIERRHYFVTMSLIGWAQA